MLVSEIFLSIQGESTYAGLPCVFIRLTGCNLRCAYCDTSYAYAHGELLSLDAVLERALDYAVPLVEITGGEPLLQPDAPLLAQRLLEAGRRVLIETNGSQDISRVDPRCARIMDVKCPSSGEAASFDAQNIQRLTLRDEVKCVIADASDYAYARDRLAEIKRAAPETTVLFSPVHRVLPAETLVSWMLRDRLDARLNLQLHKYVWPPDTRGV